MRFGEALMKKKILMSLMVVEFLKFFKLFTPGLFFGGFP